MLRVPVVNVVNVTNSMATGPNSITDAIAKVTDINDPNYQNQAQIVISSGITAIASLPAELFTGSVPLTSLEITFAGSGRCTITPFTANAFRFINESGSNGFVLTLENLSLEDFGAVATMTDTGDGGAVHVECPLTATNCGFQYNTADGSGGAIFTTNTLTVTDGYFFGNHADGNGGAIAHSLVNGTGFPVTITSSAIMSNTAGGDGGGVYYYTGEGQLSISDTLFMTNNATGNGGAVYQYGGAIDADGSSMGNMAGGTGEMFYLLDLDLADIDVSSSDAATALYLVSAIPPSNPAASVVHSSAISGGYTTNWPTTNWY
jgi:predicted outer membrane repeat protein